MTGPDKRVGLDALVSRIAGDSKLAIPANGSGVPVAATLALIRAGIRKLHLVAMPTSGLQADLLIGAGCAGVVECAAVSLGEFGLAPRFRAAAEDGRIVVRDATCPAVHAGFIAAAKAIPFLPVRGILGSDLLRHRSDWIEAQNPFSQTPDPIVLVAAIHPDTMLFHTSLADRFGNVWVGRRRELITGAHAARQTLVTAETVVDENLLADPVRAPGLLSHVFVDAVAEVPDGAWPLGLDDRYPPDGDFLRAYAAAARTEEGFSTILNKFGHGRAHP